MDYNLGPNPYQELIRKILTTIIKDDILLYCGAAAKTNDNREPIPPLIYSEIYCKYNLVQFYVNFINDIYFICIFSYGTSIQIQRGKSERLLQ